MTVDEIGDSNLKVGIVGGGKRCKTILQMFQRQTQPQRTASVVIRDRYDNRF